MSENPQKLSFDQLVQQGQLEFDHQNFHQAASFFGMAYNQKQEIDLNRILVGTLYEDQQFSLANVYLQDFLDDYLNTERLFKLAINVLLKNQNFIYAREMAGFADPIWAAAAIEQIENEERIIRTQMAVTQKELVQSFYHLSDGDFAKQRQRFESSFKLPLHEWWSGSKFLLLDPYINPLIRSSLIETAQKLQIDEKVDFYWIDHKIYQVNPSKIKPLLALPEYTKLKKRLDEELGADDPIANDMLTSNLRMQTSLLYPKISAGIFEGDYWIDEMINQYQGADRLSRMSDSQRKIFDQVEKTIDEIVRSEHAADDHAPKR
ncbi:MAG: hypothetical protein ABF913_03635 [Oenococcus sp.]|uniref:hypothetical protein n=1 Tax=Oenococcus sp. TaxID=1979414 RepID=UPI0039E890A8